MQINKRTVAPFKKGKNKIGKGYEQANKNTKRCPESLVMKAIQFKYEHTTVFLVDWQKNRKLENAEYW